MYIETFDIRVRRGESGSLRGGKRVRSICDCVEKLGACVGDRKKSDEMIEAADVESWSEAGRTQWNQKRLQKL